MRIRKGDMVQVVSGDESSNPAPRRVVQVLEGGRKIVVQGVNTVFKHVRRGHPKSPQGGRLQLDMPIDSSRVMLYCDSCKRGVRVGYRYLDDGSKERFCRRCGTGLGVVSPPKARYARK